MSVLIVTNNMFLFSKPSQTCFTPAPLSKTQRLSARSILWLTSNPPYITTFFNSFFGGGRIKAGISKQILYSTNNRASTVCYLGSVFDVIKKNSCTSYFPAWKNLCTRHEGQKKIHAPGNYPSNLHLHPTPQSRKLLNKVMFWILISSVKKIPHKNVY